MPGWMQFVIGLSVFAAAVTALWRTVLRPGAKLITTGEEMLPLMQQLTTVFKGSTPESFATLHEIAQQFKTDGGSSLRDVVNRLDAAATENKLAAEVLKLNVEVVKELAVQDRQQLARLLLVLDRLNVQVVAGQDAGIARDKIVADDLASAQHRADNEPSTAEGAAADAASRSG